MEWNVIIELIDPRLLIVVAACWVLGFVLKQTPKVQDWTIIYIILVVAILMTIWLIGFSPEAVLQGVLVAALAVFGHQLYKQTKERV